MPFLPCWSKGAKPRAIDLASSVILHQNSFSRSSLVQLIVGKTYGYLDRTTLRDWSAKGRLTHLRNQGKSINVKSRVNSGLYASVCCSCICFYICTYFTSIFIVHIIYLHIYMYIFISTHIQSTDRDRCIYIYIYTYIHILIYIYI